METENIRVTMLNAHAVSAVWMGLFVLAAARYPVWKAACIPHVNSRNYGKSRDQSKHAQLD